MKNYKKNYSKFHLNSQTKSVSISLASPEDILSWSHGEVLKPETINYRTHKPEAGGLSDERIFGPEKDYQCSCGKYNGIQFKGFSCEKCGVEITKAFVRRERMGHIKLATPVSHVWYLRKSPNYIAVLLGLSAKHTQQINDFISYIVISVNKEKMKEYDTKLKESFKAQVENVTRKETKKKLQNLYDDRVKELKSIKPFEILDEEKYFVLEKRFPKLFTVGIGPKVLYEMLKEMNLVKIEKELSKDIEIAKSIAKKKIYKRLSAVRSFLRNQSKPEWMFITVLPVLPPGLRPIVALDGGRFASSDLTDLYRAVITRNNRLKELITKDAPEVILRNEQRILQEAVDVLFDNSISSVTASGVSPNRFNSKTVKSLTEYLGKKQGYFRANLLGKRVDYSARSVIVVGPNLKLDECGIPKQIALELFKPFVISELIKKDLAYNMRNANKMIDDGEHEIWDVLEQVIKGKYVILNRQPTLHRLGTQAFKPTLVEGIAIELHPLVCTAYNADFDGDNMVVYLPLTAEAQAEAKYILNAKNNIINPANGEIISNPNSHDMSLGCYTATVMNTKPENKVKYFSSVNEAIASQQDGLIKLTDQIKISITDTSNKYKEHNGNILDTTVGRIFFNEIFPDEIKFINETVNKSQISKIIKNCMSIIGKENTVLLFDSIKTFGFEYATKSGTTFAWTDLLQIEDLESHIKEGWKKHEKNIEFFSKGLISKQERERMNVENWMKVRNDIKDKILSKYTTQNSITDMILSGARGSVEQLAQVVGIIGPIASATGEVLEHPIAASYKYGLTSIEYFINSYGGRKGIVDKSLKTANAGYFSRRLFDVSQEIVVTEENCKTTKGFEMTRKTKSGIPISFENRIYGRYVSEDVLGNDKKIIVKKNKMILSEQAKQIDSDESIEKIMIRSALKCESEKGICQMCYGMDTTTSELIDLGEPAGTNAALSIGEPGTQLTLRVFHQGGILSVGGDITAGLPRVLELLDKRIPKAEMIFSAIEGKVIEISKNQYDLNTIYIEKDSKDPKDSKTKSTIVDFVIPANRQIKVKVGDKVKKEDRLTDGSANLDTLYEISGKEITQKYIFDEVTKMYELQGLELIPVHLEIIIRQMFSRREIIDSGGSTYTVGDVIESSLVNSINNTLKKAGKDVIKTKEIILGLPNIPKSRNSFLSTASFQCTTNILLSSAVKGEVDSLDDLKSNVITGRLVPIGTAFKGSKKYKMIEKVQQKIKEDEEEYKRMLELKKE